MLNQSHHNHKSKIFVSWPELFVFSFSLLVKLNVYFKILFFTIIIVSDDTCIRVYCVIKLFYTTIRYSVAVQLKHFSKFGF